MHLLKTFVMSDIYPILHWNFMIKELKNVEKLGKASFKPSSYDIQ